MIEKITAPKRPPVKEPFNVRMPPNVRKALDQAALDADRPSSYIALKAIEEWLQSKGYLK